jgi:hypothetical protein
MPEIKVALNKDSINSALAQFGITDVKVKEPVASNPFKPASVKAKGDIEKGVNNELGGDANEMTASILESHGKLLKAFEEISTALAESKQLMKGMQGELSKANETIAKNNKTISSLSKRVKTIEETPMPKKSLENNFIEKGFGPGGRLEAAGSAGKPVVKLSMQNDRSKIIQFLVTKSKIDLMEQGKHDPKLVKALTGYESSRLLPADVIEQIKNEDNIIITK